MIVKTEIIKDTNFKVPDNYNFVIKHEKIKNITFKETWSFSMLRDAALLTLEIQERLLQCGYSLKDASTYNIQFCNHRPIFIDIGSIIKSEDEIFWRGYRQFCEMFLNPLLIASSLNISLQDFSGLSTRGIHSSVTWKLLKFVHKLKIRNIVNVFLQIDQKNPKKIDNELYSELYRAGFTKKNKLNQIRNLKKFISNMALPKLSSNWDNYSVRNHYSTQEIDKKLQLISYALNRKNYLQIVDWGCNDGMFSKKATEYSSSVSCVAIDNDPEVIDRLYLECKRQKSRILPLVVDISNPPGAYGFNNLERESFLDNISPDLNIAYALVHHLFISENITWAQIFELFSTKGDLIIEFPLPQDKKVQEILKLKSEPELYLDLYKCDVFENELTKYYKIDKKVPLSSRNIYFCENKNK